jgi:O-antigen ligase
MRISRSRAYPRNDSITAVLVLLALSLSVGLAVAFTEHLSIIIVGLVAIGAAIMLLRIPEVTLVLYLSSSDLWKPIFITEYSVDPVTGVWTFRTVPYSEWITPVLLVLTVLGIMRRRFSLKWPPNYIIIPLSLFLLLLTMSLLWSPGLTFGLEDLSRLLFLDVSTFYVAYTISCQGYRDTRRLLLFYSIAGIIYAIGANINILLTTLDASSLVYGWSSQLFPGSWLNPARYLVACLMILFSLLPTIGNLWRKLTYLACAVLVTAVVTLNARTTLLSMLASSLALILFGFWTLRKEASGRLILAVLISALFLSLLITQVPNVERFLSRHWATIEYGGGLDKRWAHLQLFLGLFWDSPFIGHGIGGWRALTETPYPHNMVLEVLFATGIIGLIIWLWFLIRVWLTGVRPLFLRALPFDNRLLTLAAIGGAMNALIVSVANGGFVDWRQQWFFWGIMLALAKLAAYRAHSFLEDR